MIAAGTILFVFKHDVSGPGRSYEALCGDQQGAAAIARKVVVTRSMGKLRSALWMVAAPRWIE